VQVQWWHGKDVKARMAREESEDEQVLLLVTNKDEHDKSYYLLQSYD